MKRKIFNVLFALVLLASFSLVATPVSVGANGGPNPTFATVSIPGMTTPSATINIGWERDTVNHSGTDAIHVTTSTATLDYAMVIVPTNFTLATDIPISYWGYTVADDVKAPDEIYLFLDIDNNGTFDIGAGDILLTSHKPGPGASKWYGEWHEWTLTDPDNDWHIVPGYTEASLGDYIDRDYSVLAIALTAGPSTASGPVNVNVYFDELTVNGSMVLDDDTGVIDVPVPFAGFPAPCIQDAINAALLGDTINVAAGTYTEQVNIAKSLTITGAGQDTTHIVSPDPTTMVIYDYFGCKGLNQRYIVHRGTNIPVVRIAASDVTFEGFHVDLGDQVFFDVLGTGSDSTYSKGVGILVDHVETTPGTPDVFTGITIQDTMVDGLLWDDYSDCIKVLAQATVNINHNTLYGYGESAVSAQGMDTPRAAFYPTVTANDNTMYGGSGAREGNHYFFGIGYWSGATGSADGNTIYNAPNGNGYALNSWTPNPVSFTNNIIRTDGGAVGGYSAQLYESSNLIFSGNDIQDQGLAGAIWKGGGTGITITITNNEIINCIDGFIGDGLTAGSVTLHNNNFSGIADGHYALDMAGHGVSIWGSADPCTITADATLNWWGDASGPKQATTNPSASGDEASDNVNYSPWLDAASPGGTERDYNVENITQVTTYNSIQPAINAASPGDIILVAAGTYNLTAPIVVDESVILTGDVTTPSNVVINAPTTGDDRDVFQVKSSGVTIQGFTIQGALDAPGTAAGTQNSGIVIGAWWVGAAIPGLQDIVISYNEITNCSKGISVYRAQHVEISYNNIHHNPTSNVRPGSWPGKGIMLYGDGSGAQNYDIDILNNEIYSNGLFGIELNHWATTTGDWIDVDVLIDGNTIYDNGMSWDDVGYAYDCGRGISANGHETGVTITNNEIYGHWSTSGVRFYSSAAGIRLNDSKGFVIDDNNVHDNMRGIYIYGGDTTFGDENTGFVVTGNDVHGNAQGIVFGDGDVGSAHNNNIYDNDVATYITDGVGPYGAVNLGTGTFDATNNWWGDASGPIHVGTNPLATGNEVSDNVDYDPWFGAGVEDSKSQETETGDDTIDAKTEADTEVDKSGTGTPTITVAKYSDNPGRGFAGDTGKYIDVHIDDPAGVTEIEIKVYYTDAEIAGLVESSLILRWWDGTRWVACSDSGVNTTDIPPYSGYIWAKIRNDTIPTLDQLSGTVFGGSGRVPIVGGAPPPVPPPGTTDVRGKVSTAGVFTRSVTAISEDGLCTLTIPEGTVGLTEELEPLTEITIVIMDEPPPPPEAAHIIGLVYDFQPSGATFELPITLTFSYDPADIPEGVAEEDLVLAFYIEGIPPEPGEWIELEGCVVDTVANTITAPVAHFTTFGAMVFIPVPATFSLSGLEVSPAEVEIGSPVTISAVVENTGGEEGTCEVTFKVNDKVEETKNVALEPGASEEVTFTTSRDVSGSYSVDVNGLTGSFTVKAPPELPPEEAPPEEVPPEVKPINWPLVGGLIAAVVVVVGLLFFFLVRRRRAY